MFEALTSQSLEFTKKSQDMRYVSFPVTSHTSAAQRAPHNPSECRASRLRICRGRRARSGRWHGGPEEQLGKGHTAISAQASSHTYYRKPSSSVIPWCSERRGSPHRTPARQQPARPRGRTRGVCPNPHLQGLLADFLYLDSTPRTAQVIFHLRLFQQPLTGICSLMTSADGLNRAVRSRASSETPRKTREERMSHRHYARRTKSPPAHI